MRRLAVGIYVLGAAVTGVACATERKLGGLAGADDLADWGVVIGVAAVWPLLWGAVAVVTVNDVYNDRRLPSV